jgi:cyclic-di-AMP phosphodiesterase PgpH
MSVLFALGLTAVQVGDRYVRSWKPVLGGRARVTLRIPYGPRVIHERDGGRHVLHIEHGRVVVPRGELLRPDSDADLTAYSYDLRHRSSQSPRSLAVFAIFFTLAMGLTAYLRKFGHQRARLLRVQAGVLLAMGGVAIAAKALLLFTAVSEFWIALAAVPLWVATSFDRRTAFLVTIVLSFSVASFVDFDLVVLCVLLARGMAATLLYLDRKHTRHMILAGVLAGISAMAFYVAIMVALEGTYDWRGDLSYPLGSQLVACLGGGLAAGLLSAVFRSPAERLMGNVPRDRLLDLTDLEQPLLVQLQREAPGTFAHSRAMANLAEQAASAIGADALLTRVGAYYHDVGKSTQPKYFVENLALDERSPHDDLDPEVSADAIMAHVVLGTKLLREGGVPEPVVEFAYTHHGTQLVEYFWNKCLQQDNPKNLEPDAFRYPGMRPQTRETAIVMLVDSIEAASRTVDPPEREAFEQMIQRIVFTKLKDGQLDDSGLNMSDLNVTATRMSDILVNMHHHRIKYHWQAQRAEEFGVPSNAVTNLALRAFQSAPSERKSRPPSEPVLEASYELTEEPPPVVPRAPMTPAPSTTREGEPPEARAPAAESKESGAHPAPDADQKRDRSGGAR